jgi:chemosensory pili system protein ChpA (sensor histidine kinase/response regulator)
VPKRSRPPLSGDEPLVLLADDHLDSREMYAAVLGANGYRAAQAADGAEALRLAKLLRPAAIVLDLEMPRVHGLTVIKRIRADAQLRGIPILVVTAYDHLEQDALKAGASSVCVKPCAPDDLTKQIRRLLRSTEG